MHTRLTDVLEKCRETAISFCVRPPAFNSKMSFTLIRLAIVLASFHRMQAQIAWYHSMSGRYHWRTESTLWRTGYPEPPGIILRISGIHLRIAGTRSPEYSYRKSFSKTVSSALSSRICILSLLLMSTQNDGLSFPGIVVRIKTYS